MQQDHNRAAVCFCRSLTKYPEVCDLLQGPPHVAAGLEAASIGVDVHVAHGLLDSDAEAQRAPGEGVQHVHKVSVVGGEAPVGMHPLKVGTSWVQTCGQRRGNPFSSR